MLTAKELKQTKEHIIKLVESVVTGVNRKVIVEGNVIKGIVPKLTKRDILVSAIAKKLQDDPDFKNTETIRVTKVKSVTVDKKKISSGSNVVKVIINDTKPEVVLAITVKPGTALVSLLPADLGIVDTMTYAEYITKVRFALKHLPEEKAPEDYRKFLNEVFTAAISPQINPKIDNIPKKLNAYVVEEVLADISKTFSEVLGPALVNKQMKNKVKTVIFPKSKNERAFDFKVVTEDDIMMSYSVKSGVAKVTNTVKPNDIHTRLEKNLGSGVLDKATSDYKKKKTTITARKVIKILSDEKPTEGAIEAAMFLEGNEDKKKKKKNLADSVKLLQNAELELNALMSMAFKDELSFLKFVLKKDGSMTTTIISGKQIKDLQKKLMLRSKGIRQGPTSSRLTEKMGVTPP